MINGLLKVIFAFLVTTCLLTVAAVNVASANDLKMYIQNNSSGELYYNSNTNVKAYPSTISAGAKSSEIQSEGEDKGSVGQITYMNNKDEAAATCAVTLEFSWTYNPVSGHCDDKNFTFVNKGECTIAKAGNCDGNNSCSCHFNVSAN